MLNQKDTPLYSGIILGASILLIAIVLYWLNNANQPLIEQSIRQSRLSYFNYFLNESEYDNDLLASSIQIDDIKYYQATKNGSMLQYL